MSMALLTHLAVVVGVSSVCPVVRDVGGPAEGPGRDVVGPDVRLDTRWGCAGAGVLAAHGAARPIIRTRGTFAPF